MACRTPRRKPETRRLDGLERKHYPPPLQRKWPQRYIQPSITSPLITIRDHKTSAKVPSIDIPQKFRREYTVTLGVLKQPR